MAEVLEFQVNPQSALKALSDINAAITNNEGRFVGANKNMEGAFQRVSDTILKLTDRSYQANERYIRSIEAQAAAINKAPVDKLIQQRDRLIQRLGNEQAQVERVRAAYDKLIEAEKKRHGGESPLKGIGETVASLIESPFQTAEISATGLLEKLGPVGVGLAGVTTAAIATGAAVFEMTRSFGESAEALVNLSHSSGIALDKLDELQAIAKLTGTDISMIARAGTAMATALEDGGSKGTKMLDTLSKLHVASYNFNGTLRDEGEILPEVLEALSHITDANQRLALAAEALGPRTAKALQPVIANLDRLKEKAHELGYGMRNDIIEQGAEAAERLHEMGLSFDHVKAYVAIGAVTLAEYASKLKGLGSALVEATGPLGAFGEAILRIIGLQNQFASKQTEEFKKQYHIDEINQAIKVWQQYEQAISQAAAARQATGFAQAHPEETLKSDIAELEKRKTEAQRIIDAARRGGGVGKEAEAKAEKEFVDSSRLLESKQKQLKAIEGAAEVTERLRQDVSKAQQGELTGLAKINAEYNERIRHMKEELQYNTLNAALARQIRDAEIAHYNQTQTRLTSATLFNADKSVAAEEIKNQGVIFAAQRKSAGSEFDQSDIQRQYQDTISLAQNAFDIAAQHVRDLRAMKAEAGEIERAQIEATKTFALSAMDAETKRRVQLIDLAKQQRDEEDKTAKANFDNARKLQDAISSEQQRRDRDVIQRQIHMAEATGMKNPDSQVQVANIVEQLRIQAAQVEHDQSVARIAHQTEDAKKLPENTADERRQKEAELNNLRVEGIKAEGELQRQIDDAHEDRVLKIIALEQKELEEIKSKTESLLHTLFTSPRNFGNQLKTAIRDAALKPVEEKLSVTISDQIYKILHNGQLPGDTGKLADLRVGKIDDALKVYVTNHPEQKSGVPAAAQANINTGQALKRVEGKPLPVFDQIQRLLHLPGERKGEEKSGNPADLGKLSDLRVGKVDDAIKVYVTNQVKTEHGQRGPQPAQESNTTSSEKALKPIESKVSPTIVEQLQKLLNLPGTKTEEDKAVDPSEIGKLSNLKVGKEDDALKVFVINQPGPKPGEPALTEQTNASNPDELLKRIANNDKLSPLTDSEEVRKLLRVPNYKTDKSNPERKQGSENGKLADRVGMIDDLLKVYVTNQPHVRPAEPAVSQTEGNINETVTKTESSIIRDVVPSVSAASGLSGVVGALTKRLSRAESAAPVPVAESVPVGAVTSSIEFGQGSIPLGGSVYAGSNAKPVEDRLSVTVLDRIYSILHNDALKVYVTNQQHQSGLSQQNQRNSTSTTETTTETIIKTVAAPGPSMPPGSPGGVVIPSAILSGSAGLVGSLAGLFSGGAENSAAPVAESVPAGAVTSSIDFGEGSIPLGGSVFGSGNNPVASWDTTPPFIPESAPATPATGGGFDLGGLLGGGQSGNSGGLNLGSILHGLGGGSGSSGGGLLSSVWNPSAPIKDPFNINPGEGTTAGGLGGVAGGVASVASSPVAGAVGLMAAKWGLLGGGAGSWGGVAAGTLGGAELGFQAGGPIGAAIGAVAGFGIGLGEHLAGVESPQHEAKRLVKQIYHVNINDGMADQIVALAKQKYGGTVSIAVRDPQVRQMLELFSAGTGQLSKFPQSATTPHSASFSEQNGVLSQDLSYRYGQSFAFQSSLPISGGYQPSGYYPNPNGGSVPPIYISMNASGQNLADFMTGSYVTPDAVNSQMSTAQMYSMGRVQNSAVSQGQANLYV